MFFRFAAALFLVVIVSMAGVWLEKQTLAMRREVSVQYYQTDLLLELLVRLRLETQRLTAPAQMAATIEDASKVQEKRARLKAKSPAQNRMRDGGIENTPGESSLGESRLPLLRFRQPFNPEGID